jgi:glutaredoxin-like YruB-family protein
MKVVVYTAPACPYCVFVKSYLKRNNMPFEEVDISKNPDKKREMVEKSGQEQVPVTEVDGIVIVGFDLEKIKKALKIG